MEPDLSRAIRYMPDFWLPERLAWVECKSSLPTPGEIRAARALLATTGRPVYIVIGWPRRGGYAVAIVAAAGEALTGRSDMADLALCQLFDCKFSELYEAMTNVKN